MTDDFNERPFNGILKAAGRGAVETLLVAGATTWGLGSFLVVSVKQQRRNPRMTNFQAAKIGAASGRKAAADVLRQRPRIHRLMRLED